jgi:hypothetical protein
MVIWGVNYVLAFFTTCIKKGIGGGLWKGALKFPIILNLNTHI